MGSQMEQYEIYDLRQRIKDCQEKQKTLSEAGSIITTLLNKGDIKDPELVARMNAIKNSHINHRNCERDETIQKLSFEMDINNNKIRQINQLGGNPGEELLQKNNSISKKIQTIKELNNSQPEFYDRNLNKF